jgi:hypothetical protein
MMQHVQTAIEEMFSSPKLLAIQVHNRFRIHSQIKLTIQILSGMQFARTTVSQRSCARVQSNGSRRIIFRPSDSAALYAL